MCVSRLTLHANFVFEVAITLSIMHHQSAKFFFSTILAYYARCIKKKYKKMNKNACKTNWLTLQPIINAKYLFVNI